MTRADSARPRPRFRALVPDARARRRSATLAVLLAAGGLAVLIVSDDLPELVQSCSRVLVFRHGRVTAELGTAALTGDALQEQLSAAH